MQTLLRRTWQEGYACGLKRRAGVSSLLWFVTGAIATLTLLIASAFAQTIPQGANKYRHDLTAISRSIWGMNAPVSSLAAQLHQESGWNESARSYVGAAGIAQFMRATAADMAARHPELQPANVFDPRWGMRAQSLYMRELWAQVGPARNDCERAAFALSAYNGGLGWVRRRQRLSAHSDRCLGATCDINPGITASNQKENREYSRRILLTLTPLYSQAMWGPGWCLDYVKGP